MVFACAVSLYSNLRSFGFETESGDFVDPASCPVKDCHCASVLQELPEKLRQIQPFTSSRGRAYTLFDAVKEAGMPEAPGSKKAAYCPVPQLPPAVAATNVLLVTVRFSMP